MIEQLSFFIFRLLKMFYLPTFNYVYSGKDDMNIYYYVYLSIALILIGVCLFQIFLFFSCPKTYKFYPQKIFKVMRNVICIFIVILSLCQLVSHGIFAHAKWSAWGSFSLDERIYPNYRQVIYFAQFCKHYIKEDQQADLIISEELLEKEGSYLHRCLAYHLYPVDVKHLRQKESRYVIVYAEDNLFEYVPNGYKVLDHWENVGLIAEKILPSMQGRHYE